MMDLKEALEVVDGHRVELMWRYSPAPGDVAHAHGRTAEALSVVLTAARENYASRVVAETHALAERAREMERPHMFRGDVTALVGGRAVHCRVCGAPESDPIHQQTKETAR